MSSGTSGSSQSRATREGSFYFCIEGLPRGFTWQDLKDLIRHEASHGIWTEMYRHPDGTPGEIGCVRVQRREEADNLYNYLVQDRRYRIHLFDTSQTVPQKIRCTCSHGACIATQRSQYATTINSPAASLSWMSVTPQASYLQPAVTYASQPTMQYTTAPGPPPMAPYPAQSLEASMAGLSLDTRPAYSPFQLLCISLVSTNPEAQARASARVKEMLAQCTTPEQQNALRLKIQSGVADFRQPLATGQTPKYTIGPDGRPVNISQGVVLTETNSVFVSKLDYKATVKEIEQRFSRGDLRPLKCNLVKDQATGKSRGHAIVQYASADDARKAVTMFDGQKFKGMEISVRLDKEKTAVNPPASASSSPNYASSSSSRGRSNGGSTSGSSRAAEQRRANAGPIIANGSVIKS